MSAPRSVPPVRECHWCGGVRAPWRSRAALRLSEMLAWLRAWLVDHHPCCGYCGGKGRRP